MFSSELEQDADDLVLHVAEPLRAAPAVTILEQKALDRIAAVDERGFEPLRHRIAQIALAAGMDDRQFFEVGDDRARIENLGKAARRRVCVRASSTR